MDFSKISILFTDFDGVWTDNNVLVGDDGAEYVKCSKYDSLGLLLMREIAVPVVVISSEKNEVVKVRCKKLELECFSAVNDKTLVIKKVCKRYNVLLETVGFVGNDINDIPALKMVGFPICVADAADGVKEVSKFITNSKGGCGALREIFEKIATVKP